MWNVYENAEGRMEIVTLPLPNVKCNLETQEVYIKQGLHI